MQVFSLAFDEHVHCNCLVKGGIQERSNSPTSQCRAFSVQVQVQSIEEEPNGALKSALLLTLVALQYMCVC